MPRHAPAFTVLLLAVAAARGQESDPIKAKLDQVRATHAAQVEKLQAGILAALEKREEIARKDGNKKLLDQVVTEKEAFVTDLETPYCVPADAYLKELAAAHRMLDTAYLVAIKEYTKAKKDDAAAEAEKQHKEFRDYALRFNPKPDRHYRLLNAHTGLALDVEVGSKTQGAKLKQTVPSPDAESQHWKFRKSKEGYRALNRNSGMLINVPRGEKRPGLGLIQWPQGNAGNEFFTLVRHERGFMLMTEHGLLIAVKPTDVRPATPIVQLTPTGRANEVWRLVRVPK